MGSSTSPERVRLGSQAHETRICLCLALPPCPRISLRLPSPRLDYPPASLLNAPTTTSGHQRHQSTRRHHGLVGLASAGSVGSCQCRYGNINPLSIDYACRPRLRSRLTLGGLAWPRNPWSSGGGVSHSPFATHACILTRTASTTGSLRCFAGRTTLPYPSTRLDVTRR